MKYLEFAGLHNKPDEEIEAFTQTNGNLGIHKLKYNLITYQGQYFILESESTVLKSCSTEDLNQLLRESDTIDEIRFESKLMNNIIGLLQTSHSYKHFILFRNNKLKLPEKIIDQYNLRSKPSIRRENRLSKLSLPQKKELEYRQIEKNLKREFWSAFENFNPQCLFKHEKDSLYVLELANMVIKSCFDSYLQQMNLNLDLDQRGNFSLQPKRKYLLTDLWYEFAVDIVSQKLPPKLCRYCGKPFSPTREWQEYCDPSEQVLAKQRRYNYRKGHSMKRIK